MKHEKRCILERELRHRKVKLHKTIKLHRCLKAEKKKLRNDLCCLVDQYKKKLNIAKKINRCVLRDKSTKACYYLITIFIYEYNCLLDFWYNIKTYNIVL